MNEYNSVTIHDIDLSMDNDRATTTYLPPSDPPSRGSPHTGGDGNQSLVIQGSSPVFQQLVNFAPETFADKQTAPPRRKCGRPSKPKFEGPRRPQGRPKGSGKLQCLLQNANGGVEPKKRRGRPLKEKNSGGVTVDYHITVPGSRSSVPTTATAGMEPSTMEGTSISSNVAVPTPPLPISPEEDPPPGVDLDEEILDEEADGTGLGDDDDSDDDDDDDEGLDNRKGKGKAPAKKARKHHPLPPWLLDAFKAVVADCDQRDAEGLPPLYSTLKTFFYPQQSTYFLTRSNDLISPGKMYNPQFFVWDPFALNKGLRCPIKGCGSTLRRHGVIPRPRRCIGTSGPIWMIGYRYLCPNTSHPGSATKHVTFQSWDPRILNILPNSLAAEFPARLTHRSAISNDLFKWMRACLANGMGPKQFSDALRVVCTESHDELHLQYLYLVEQSAVRSWADETLFKSFPAIDDTGPDGFHGFVPSAQWLRDMYDKFIEEHQQDFNQHCAMLSGEICAMDHSHKLTKHIIQVNGERVFTALLTVTNEKGEIRICNLVATKSHSQFEAALTQMRRSLALYGHSQPTIFYTDNMSDKSFLEASFPSLRADVVPIEKYGELEAYVLPPDVRVNVRSGDNAINAALSTIVDCLPVEEGEQDLVIGFDTEWNMSLGDNGQCERGIIATIQIAFEKRIEILQVSELLAHRRLPEKLKMLLCNPRVKKVGRMVGSDLRQLQEAVQSPFSYIGALDLAMYAKDRQVIPNAKCGLGDLCAVVLRKRLNKNVSERMSTAWEQADLSVEQQHYAACDAYVPLLIFHELSRLSVPKQLSGDLIPSTPILLYNMDNTTVIAVGHLARDVLEVRNFDNINLTPTRTLVTISEVRVPGAVVTTHNQRALNSFGNTPFSLVCLRSHLRSYNPITPVPGISTVVSCLPEGGTASLSSPTTIRDVGGDPDSLDGTGNLLVSMDSTIQEPEVVDSASGESSRLMEVDEDSRRFGAETIGIDTEEGVCDWETSIRSRVLKDLFHVFNMLRLSTMHALQKEFARALRDVDTYSAAWVCI